MKIQFRSDWDGQKLLLPFSWILTQFTPHTFESTSKKRMQQWRMKIGAVQMRLPAPGQFRLRPPAPAGQFRRRPPAPARQFRLGHQNQGSSD